MMKHFKLIEQSQGLYIYFSVDALWSYRIEKIEGRWRVYKTAGKWQQHLGPDDGSRTKAEAIGIMDHHDRTHL